ncbi:MAG: hypothetical protein AAB538_00725, partial [Patescibacteria group bacterium]
MTKNNWDIYERIYSSHWFLTSYNAQGFGFDFPAMGGGSFMTQAVYVMEKGMCRYIFDSDEFERAAQYTSDRLINDDKWRENVYQNINLYTRRYFAAGERLRKTPLDTLSHGELVKIVREIIPLQHYHQVYSVLANGVVLDGRNHLSDRIREELRSLMGSPDDFDEQWSLLSQSAKMSLRQRKEHAIAQLASESKVTSRVVERKLRNLHQKYCWLDYNNMGPAASFEKFEQELAEARSQNKNITLKEELKALRKKQIDLMRRLRISQRGKFLIRLAQGVIWQKGYRKDMQYHGFYCYENLFRELARRQNTPD